MGQDSAGLRTRQQEQTLLWTLTISTHLFPLSPSFDPKFLHQPNSVTCDQSQ